MKQPQLLLGKAMSDGSMQSIEETCSELYFSLSQDKNISSIIKENKLTTQREKVLKALTTPAIELVI